MEVTTPLPRISIVTPSYNQGEFLEECIDSILGQNYPNLEYIIMDGGSSDNSVEIIRRYEKYLTYWQSQPDGGQYLAIQEGFKRTSGEVMSWLNSDDKYHPGAFLTVATVLANKNAVEWLTGRPSWWGRGGEVTGISDTLATYCRKQFLDKRYDQPFLQQESTFWKRSLWERAGGCLRTDLSYAGDLELWVRFFRSAELYSVDAVLGGYRRHGNQKAALAMEEYMAEADKVIDEELLFLATEPAPRMRPAPEPILVSPREVGNFLTDHGLSAAVDPPVSTKGVETEPVISIIIPSKNGAPRIDDVLRAVFGQKSSLGFEVIIIDSGSTDETLAILRNYPVRLQQIPPEEFSHSRTRNQGAALAVASDYLVFLNQDAVPTDEFWLDNLVRAIRFTPGLKAVCAAEILENVAFFDVSGVASYVFKSSHTKGVHVIEGGVLLNLPGLPKQLQRELFPFTTVCAIFEKTHFLAHPFDTSVPWGEDLHWAVRNSRDGFSAGCTTLASVYHHHDYTPEQLAAVQGHVDLLYQSLFEWSPGKEPPIPARFRNLPAELAAAEHRLQAVLTSASWSITAPLRWLHSALSRIRRRR